MQNDEKKMEKMEKELGELREKLSTYEMLESVYRQAEKELRIKEQAIASSINGIAFSDPEGNLTYVNASFLKMWGYDAYNEVIGRHAVDFWEKRENVPGLMKILEEKGSVLSQLKGRKKDGSLFDVQLSASLVKDKAGKGTCMMGSFVDITESKKAAEEVKKSREFLESIINAIPDPVFVKDDQHRMVLLNEAARAAMGAPMEELLGKTELDFLTKEQAEVFWAEDDMALEGVEAVICEEDITWKGEVRTVSILKKAFKDPVTGKKFIVGYAIDVTETKNAESVLRESEERFRNLVERAGDGICILQDGLVKYVNRYLVEIMKYSSPDEMVGRPFRDFLDGKEAEKVTAFYERRMAGEEVPARYETVFRDAGGGSINVEINAGIMPFAGRNADFVLVHNVTERKKTEDMLRASELKFRTLVEKIPAVTYIADLDETSTTLYVSPQIKDIAGMDPVEYQEDPDTWVRTMHPEDRERVLGAVKKCHETRKNLVVEYRMVRPGGGVVWVRDEAEIVYDYDGTPLFLQGVILNITERKEAEDRLKEQKELLDKTNKDLKWKVEELEAALGHIKVLEGLIPICVNCKKIHLESGDPKDPETWVSLEKYLSDKTDASLTHGLCPDCVKKMYEEVRKQRKGDRGNDGKQ